MAASCCQVAKFTFFSRPDGSVKSIRPQHLEHTADALNPLEPRSLQSAVHGGYMAVMWRLYGG